MVYLLLSKFKIYENICKTQLLIPQQLFYIKSIFLNLFNHKLKKFTIPLRSQIDLLWLLLLNQSWHSGLVLLGLRCYRRRLYQSVCNQCLLLILQVSALHRCSEIIPVKCEFLPSFSCSMGQLQASVYLTGWRVSYVKGQ